MRSKKRASYFGAALALIQAFAVVLEFFWLHRLSYDNSCETGTVMNIPILLTVQPFWKTLYSYYSFWLFLYFIFGGSLLWYGFGNSFEALFEFLFRKKEPGSELEKLYFYLGVLIFAGFYILFLILFVAMKWRIPYLSIFALQLSSFYFYKNGLDLFLGGVVYTGLFLLLNRYVLLIDDLGFERWGRRILLLPLSQLGVICYLWLSYWLRGVFEGDALAYQGLIYLVIYFGLALLLFLGLFAGIFFLYHRRQGRVKFFSGLLRISFLSFFAVLFFLFPYLGEWL